MDRFLEMLLIIITGFTVLAVGFNFRDRSWGIGLLMLGAACMLSLLLYKMAITFG